MFKLFTRTIIILLIILAMSIIIANMVGQQFNPYTPLVTYDYNDNIQSNTTFDPITYASHTRQFEQGMTQSNFSQRLGIGYSSQWVDGLTYIYIERFNQDKDLLTTLDTGSQQIKMAWNFDFETPMYIVVKTIDEDTVTIHQLDMTTGDATILGLYPFSMSPVDANIIYGEHLMVTRSGFFLSINLITGDFHSDTSARYPYNTSYDRQFLQYSNARDPLNALDIGQSHYLLNLDSYEVIEISLPDDTLSITNIRSWSPVDLTLSLIDENDHLWLYDVATQSAVALPEYLRLQGFIYEWSPDGQYLATHLMPNESDQITYGFYSLEAQTFTELFSVTDTRSQFEPFSLHNIQWSPDQRWILVRSHGNDDLYQIYDATTGILAHEGSMQFADTLPNGSIYWVHDLR